MCWNLNVKLGCQKVNTFSSKQLNKYIYVRVQADTQTERGSTRSHLLENSLWKKLWTCRKTDCRMNTTNTNIHLTEAGSSGCELNDGGAGFRIPAVTHIFVLTACKSAMGPTQPLQNDYGLLFLWEQTGRNVGLTTVPDNVHQLHFQQPSTYAKPEAVSAVLGSWWWAVCRPKHVELHVNME
jgi:hypothetical protein